MTRPIPLQDTTTNLRPDNYLLDYNKRNQSVLRQNNVDQSVYKEFYSKESEDLKSPTWSEVISQDKSNVMKLKQQVSKPSINAQIIQQLLQKDDSTNGSVSNEADADPSNLSATHTPKNVNIPKYISDSVYLMSSINNNIDFNNTSIERPYTVIRVSNVSYYFFFKKYD